MVHALHVPLGIQPEGAMLVYLDLSGAGQAGAVALKRDDATVEKQRAVLEAARSIAGVTAAGAVSQTPMTGGIHGTPVFPPGTTEFKLNNSVLTPYVYRMSPGYLATVGVRLLDGRDVSWQDTTETPYVAIVNETFARKMWSEAPAIGQRFILLGHLTEVVGVAQNGKYHDLEETPQPVAYLPSSQSGSGEEVFVIRSQRTPSEMAAVLERTLGGIVPNVPITVLSWPDSLAGELFPERAAIVAPGVLGLLATMLAVTGIFGMAAYSVSRRMKELGIRMALSARKTEVMRAAVGRPIVLLGIGSVVGLLAGIFARRLLGQIVYQANPSDPVVVAGAVLTMALLGIAASAIPTRRALAIDPSTLMRDE